MNHNIPSATLPHIGQRMIKTAVAVFFCLLIYRLLGYEGETMPVEAPITAIICMQPFISDSRTFAFNRFSGTFIGAGWGLIFLVLLYFCPILGQNFIVLYALMGVGVLLAVYTAVTLHVPDTSGLSAIVFMCIVVQFPDIEAPHIVVARRIMGVMIGTFIAITVNLAHLPREKKTDLVFFVRAKDLTPDRFSQIPPAVLFHLNRLYEDGAKICLMLEHAPAFFTMQMSACQLSVPLIVMDGAAIFDSNKNRYISVETVNRSDSKWLRSWFREKGIGYFTYIIRNNRTCIFHDGELNDLEIQVLKQLQRSPYRSYLNGEDFHSEEIVYFKVIAENCELAKLKEELSPLLKGKALRLAIRDQASTPGVSGLYIYSDQATPERAQKLLLSLLQVIYPEEQLHASCIYAKSERYSEKSATQLLHRLMDAYEPVVFMKYRKR